MNVTITGPRSVGKSTISKLVARKLRLKYISSDEIGERAFKKFGGLDKAIKNGKVKGFINGGGYNLILDIFKKENNFVFDLSGGSFTSRSMSKASHEVRKIAKRKSFIVGLLVSKNVFISSIILFAREIKRPHFKNVNKLSLFWKIFSKYPRFKKIIGEHANLVVYTRDKSVDEVANEIVDRVRELRRKN